MAQAFLKRSEKLIVEADSAGIMPGSEADPVVVEAMKEVGMDVSENRPRLIIQDIVDDCDKVITMGAQLMKPAQLNSSSRRIGALLIQKVST